MYPVAGNGAPGPYRAKRQSRRSGCQVLVAIIAGSVAAGFLLCLILAGTGVIFGNTGAHPDVSVRNQLGVDQKINEVYKDYIDDVSDSTSAFIAVRQNSIITLEVPENIYFPEYGEKNPFRMIYKKHEHKLRELLRHFSLEKETISVYDYTTIDELVATDDFFNIWPSLGDSVPEHCVKINEVLLTYDIYDFSLYGPFAGGLFFGNPPFSRAFPLNNDTSYKRIVAHIEYTSSTLRAGIEGKMLENTHAFLAENGLKLDVASYLFPYQRAFVFMSFVGTGCANPEQSMFVFFNGLLGEIVYGYDTYSSPVFAEYCSALDDLFAASTEFIDYFESVPFEKTTIGSSRGSTGFYAANNLKVCDEAYVFGELLDGKVDIFVDRMIDESKYYKAFIEEGYANIASDFQGFSNLWKHVYAPEVFGITDIGWNNADDCDDPYGEPGIVNLEAYLNAMRFMEQFYNIAPHSGLAYNYIGNQLGGCEGGGNAFVERAVSSLPEYRHPGSINLGPIGFAPRGNEYITAVHELVHAQQYYPPEPRKCPSCHIRKGSILATDFLRFFQTPKNSFLEGGATFIERIARNTLFYEDPLGTLSEMSLWLRTSSRLFETAHMAARIGKFTVSEAAIFLKEHFWAFDFFFDSLEDAESSIERRLQRSISAGFTVYTAGYLHFNDTYNRMQEECTFGIEGGQPEKAFGDAMSSFGHVPSVHAVIAALEDFIDRGCTEFDYIL